MNHENYSRESQGIHYPRMESVTHNRTRGRRTEGEVRNGNVESVPMLWRQVSTHRGMVDLTLRG
jgi:hypothetical protein